MLVDTHCHLDFPEFDSDRQAVTKRAQDAGLGYIINVGSSLQGCQRSLNLTREYDFIYTTIGIHPHEADSFKEGVYDSLKGLARKEKVVAIGEIGLDYYRNLSAHENQKRLFLALIKLAKELGLPLVIHTRQAQPDTLEILKAQMPLKAVVHCFSGDELFLKECLDLGFLISFTCNLTYKKAQALRELAKLVPLERLLLETDAPYLSPEGLRGRRNEPQHVKVLAEELSRIRGLDFAKLAEATTENAIRFFNLK